MRFLALKQKICRTTISSTLILNRHFSHRRRPPMMFLDGLLHLPFLICTSSPYASWQTVGFLDEPCNLGRERKYMSTILYNVEKFHTWGSFNNLEEFFMHVHFAVNSVLWFRRFLLNCRNIANLLSISHC